MLEPCTQDAPANDDPCSTSLADHARSKLEAALSQVRRQLLPITVGSFSRTLVDGISQLSWLQDQFPANLMPVIVRIDSALDHASKTMTGSLPLDR